ncbi:unnamed protein product [Ceratitis capitata]|uniref:(Mediterranean fruit fly) hypothetical protein n=1 Tax=Ceratitis capitata TaxID=7213 RepID=A0A811U232_CERCA|nr:unnamed protein product [Ceratitis capitata]
MAAMFTQQLTLPDGTAAGGSAGLGVRLLLTQQQNSQRLQSEMDNQLWMYAGVPTLLCFCGMTIDSE